MGWDHETVTNFLDAVNKVTAEQKALIEELRAKLAHFETLMNATNLAAAESLCRFYAGKCQDVGTAVPPWVEGLAEAVRLARHNQ